MLSEDVLGSGSQNQHMAQPTLYTQRLQLVPLTDAHLELEIALDSDPEVMRYLSGRALSRAEEGETGVMDDAVRDYRDEMASEYRPVFDRLDQLITGTCPEAEVVLSYGMPTYRVGRRRLNIGVWQHGLSVYVSPNRDGGFSGRHPELAAGKGTIRLRPEDAARIGDDEFADLVRAALCA
jgi:hypothetical protein